MRPSNPTPSSATGLVADHKQATSDIESSEKAYRGVIQCEEGSRYAGATVPEARPRHRAAVHLARRALFVLFALVISAATGLWSYAWLNGGQSIFFRATDQDPNGFTGNEQPLGRIPQYIFDNAPLIHLYSREEFWPCKMPDHLHHVTPYLNYEPLSSTRNHYNLTNLDELNKAGRYVYLQSNDNVEDRPDWLSGRKNIPVDPNGPRRHQDSDWEEMNECNGTPHGSDRRQDGGDRNVQMPFESESSQPRGGRSSAPAVLVVIDKGHGIVDAFWFFFYCYNLGNKVLNIRFGNHVGDWEHTLVRFKDGRPHAVFFSEHSWGEAYTWDAVEKYGQRPVGYSAVGTHAMYGTPGTHPYILPLGLLHDETDRGPLWDPLLNSHTYTYHVPSDTLLPSTRTPDAPVEWFYFIGHWGDKSYPMSDSRQYQVVGEYHYVNGPIGPRFKNLGRQSVCQGAPEDCTVRRVREYEEAPRIRKGFGRGEEMSREDRKRFLNDTGGLDYEPEHLATVD